METSLTIGSKSVAKNFSNLVERRKDIVMHPAVQEKVSNVESFILKAGTTLPIASMSMEEFKKEILKAMKEIARDVGITYWNDAREMQERIPEVVKYLTAFHRDMSISDIRLAFDLSIQGSLDEYLPQDSRGQAETKHFQNFNKEYIGRILNAYKRLKAATWSKANKLIPEEIAEVTEEEREAFRTTFIQEIVTKFNEYKNREEGDLRPKFLVPSLVLKELKKAGIVDGNIEITENHISKGFIRMTQDPSLSKYLKSYYAKKQEEGELTGAVESRAIHCAFEDYVFKAFDTIIENNINIEDIL